MQRNPVEIRKIKLLSAAILNIAAMFAVVLKKQICELVGNVKKILYAKKSQQKIKLWRAGIFNIVAMLVAILKKKFMSSKPMSR